MRVDDLEHLLEDFVRDAVLVVSHLHAFLGRAVG
jgi:hypothetical protein